MEKVKDARSSVRRARFWAHVRVTAEPNSPGKATRILQSITGKGKSAPGTDCPHAGHGAEDEPVAGFGGKNIGLVGGFMLITNNVTGPGLIALSTTFQQGGYVFTSVMLALVMIISYLACTFICEAMSRMPGNSNFESRVEFTFLCKKVLSKGWYLTALMFFMFSLQATNVLSIVESSQTLDETFVFFFGSSYGLQIYASDCGKTSWFGGEDGCVRFRGVHQTVPSDCPFDICKPCDVDTHGFCLYDDPVVLSEQCRVRGGACGPQSWDSLCHLNNTIDSAMHEIVCSNATSVAQKLQSSKATNSQICRMLVPEHSKCIITAQEAVGQCPPDTDGKCLDSWTISLGYLVLIPLTIPLGYLNLDDNIIVQKCAFWGLILICVEWVVQFCLSSFTHACDDFNYDLVPALPGNGWTAVTGTVLYNYAYVTTVPSWVNEKKPDVSVNFTLWWGCILGTVMFVSIGYVGGIAFSFTGIGSNSQDLLSKFNEQGLAQHHPWQGGTNKVMPITLYSVYLYPIIALMTSIPIFSIIIRYNILENELCGKNWANFWAVVAPWLCAIFFYTSNFLSDLLQWAGLIITAPINFMLPCYLYIRLRQQGRAAYEDAAPELEKSLLAHDDVDTSTVARESLLTAETDMRDVDDEYMRREQGAYCALPACFGPVASIRLAWAVFWFTGIVNVIVIILQVIPPKYLN